jgi:hypothetical protein
MYASGDAAYAPGTPGRALGDEFELDFAIGESSRRAG